jgi:hypothetical protein
MNFKRLQEFVRQHGKVSIIDTKGVTHTLPGGGSDIHELIERADIFLWDGLSRSRAEMEALMSQSERGLRPGCAECDRLEKELVGSRDQDRREGNLNQKRELPTLMRFQDHRASHQ